MRPKHYRTLFKVQLSEAVQQTPIPWCVEHDARMWGEGHAALDPSLCPIGDPGFNDWGGLGGDCAIEDPPRHWVDRPDS